MNDQGAVWPGGGCNYKACRTTERSLRQRVKYRPRDAPLWNQLRYVMTGFSGIWRVR